MPHYKPGDFLRRALKAEDLNRFDEAAEVVLGQRLAQPGQRPSPASRDRLLVKNATGLALSMLSVVAVRSLVIPPGANEHEWMHRPTLNGTVPAADDVGRFAVLQGPLDAGAIGRVAVVSGVTPVWVDVLDTDHEFADVLPEDTSKLQSAACGSAKILWAESGTGTKRALVHLGVDCEAAIPPVSGSGGASGSGPAGGVLCGSVVVKTGSYRVGTNLVEPRVRINFFSGGCPTFDDLPALVTDVCDCAPSGSGGTSGSGGSGGGGGTGSLEPCIELTLGTVYADGVPLTLGAEWPEDQPKCSSPDILTSSSSGVFYGAAATAGGGSIHYWFGARQDEGDAECASAPSSQAFVLYNEELDSAGDCVDGSNELVCCGDAAIVSTDPLQINFPSATVTETA